MVHQAVIIANHPIFHYPIKNKIITDLMKIKIIRSKDENKLGRYMEQ